MSKQQGRIIPGPSASHTSGVRGAFTLCVEWGRIMGHGATTIIRNEPSQTKPLACLTLLHQVKSRLFAQAFAWFDLLYPSNR
jgi:hypothetical protein